MRDIERLHQAWITAWLENDAETIGKMMTAEYVYVAPNGKVLEREAILAIVRSPTYRLDRAPKSRSRVFPLAPGAVVLVHHSRATGSFEGRAFADNFRIATIFVKRGRTWKVGFEQASPVTS
ncbi:MAG TPA: nuclear transport factor 2 family protein [Thermoanaerobaculia bacterium]|jgi:ketosteroid isomerase-like protein|nr:nuclear transport factor 2 family protein [Thermoanaerobaculia bacterium]